MTGRAHITILTAFFSSRIATGLFVYLGHSRRTYLEPVPGGWEGVHNWWLNPWTTYDSQWYMEIARTGYQAATTAFFPLYPLLLRLGGDSPAMMAAAGVVISNLSFLLALYLLYQLTCIDLDGQAAERSVWLLAFFPTTVFFSAVYTESLFLLLLVATFLSVRTGRWGLAGGIALLAALTRNPGVLIFIALLIEYLRSAEFRLRSMQVLPLAAISLPLGGFLAVQGYFWLTFGSPTAGLESQQFYHRALGWPWIPLFRDLVDLIERDTLPIITFTHLTLIGLALFLVIFYRRILRASYAILVLGVLLMHLTYQRIIPVYTIGAARYLSTTFPFVQLLSKAVSSLFQQNRTLALILACGYTFICFIFSYLFGGKGFLG